MKIFKNILLIFFSYSVFSQYQYQLWFRNTVQYKFQNKSILDGDIQYRRQGENLIRITDYPLLYSVRIRYWHLFREKHYLLFQPGSFFQHYRIISNGSEKKIITLSELRPAIGVLFLIFQRENFRFSTSLIAESRNYVTNHSYSGTLRIRYLAGVRVNLYKKVIHGILNDEIFFNAYNIHTKTNLFDQNRLLTGTEISISTHFSVQTIYQLITQTDRQTGNFFHIHTVFLNLIFRLEKKGMTNS